MLRETLYFILYPVMQTRKVKVNPAQNLHSNFFTIQIR